MKRAELYQAWAWICDECGRENFANSIMAEWEGLTEEEKREAVIALGVIDVHETEIPEGALVTIPDEVICAHCLEKYNTAPEEPT